MKFPICRGETGSWELLVLFFGRGRTALVVRWEEKEKEKEETNLATLSQSTILFLFRKKCWEVREKGRPNCGSLQKVYTVLYPLPEVAYVNLFLNYIHN